MTFYFDVQIYDKKKFTHNALMCGFNAFGIDDTIEQGMQTLTKSLSPSIS